MVSDNLSRTPGQPARMMANRRIKQSLSWTVIPANRKPYAKLAAISAIIKRLSDGVDLAQLGRDPICEKLARKVLGLDHPSE